MNLKISPQEATQELAKRELARRKLKWFTLYNFPGFKVSWHHEILFDALERVERGELKRLMVFMPPRHSKSEIGSIQFPAWAMGKNKDRNIIEASYSGELATDFGRQTRNLVSSAEYQNIFPGVTLAADSEAKGKWNTNGRGAYNAVGVGGSTTGKGADIFIIDDPVKDRKTADSPVFRDSAYSWFRSVVRTRLSPQGAIVLIETRWHDSDLAGCILRDAKPGEWEIICLPAIATEDEPHRKRGEALWPEFFTLPILESIRHDLGTYEWSSLYQQNPIDEESQEFKKEWFRYKTRQQVSDTVTRKFATIDTALSKRDEADFTGVTKNYVDKDNNWHLSSRRWKVSSKDVVDLIFQLHNDGFEQIGIEEGAFTMAIKPFLDEEMAKRNKFPVIVMLKHNHTAKEIRIRGLVPRYEAKKIYHIEGECEDLEEELLRFPKAKNDDVSDSAAYQLQIAQPAYEQESADQGAGLYTTTYN